MESQTIEDIVAKFLKKRGWSTWYNESCWVHEKTVSNPQTQDYTRYGMDLPSAFLHEVEGLPPFKEFGLPEISMRFHETNWDVLEYYFGEKK